MGPSAHFCAGPRSRGDFADNDADKVAGVEKMLEGRTPPGHHDRCNRCQSKYLCRTVARAKIIAMEGAGARGGSCNSSCREHWVR